MWCAALPASDTSVVGRATSSVGPAMSKLLTVASSLAAFMYRSTGNREILLGIPFANRSSHFTRTHGLIMEEFFVGAEIDDGETFSSLRAKLQANMREAREHRQARLSSWPGEKHACNFWLRPFCVPGLRDSSRA